MIALCFFLDLVSRIPGAYILTSNGTQLLYSFDFQWKAKEINKINE